MERMNNNIRKRNMEENIAEDLSSNKTLKTIEEQEQVLERKESKVLSTQSKALLKMQEAEKLMQMANNLNNSISKKKKKKEKQLSEEKVKDTTKYDSFYLSKNY